MLTRTLRARVLWGFLESARQRRRRRRGRWEQSARVPPGNSTAPIHLQSRRPAAFAGTFCAGVHSSAWSPAHFSPLTTCVPRGGRRGEGHTTAPSPGCLSLRSPPGGSHLPLISCVGASFLLKPLDTYRRRTSEQLFDLSSAASSAALRTARVQRSTGKRNRAMARAGADALPPSDGPESGGRGPRGAELGARECKGRR